MNLEMSSISEAFKRKIEDAVAMVEAMNADDQNKAIHYWNEISERLQEIVNEATQNANAQLAYQLEADKLPDYIDTSQLVAMEMIERYEMPSGPLLPPPEPSAPRHSLPDSDHDSLLQSAAVLPPDQVTDIRETFQEEPPLMAESEPSPPERLPSPPPPSGTDEAENTVHMLIAADRPLSELDLSAPPPPAERVATETPDRRGEGLECTLCSRAFANRRALKNHTWTHTKPYKCPECSNTFTTKANLQVHQRRHSGERPFICPHCPMSFSMKGNLKRHIRTHSGLKPWRCDQCGSHFTEKKSLRVHARRHTGERPYQCDMCPKAFTQSGILKTHKAVHFGLRAFKCSHCERSFRQKSQLKVHEQRHLGLRKYNCSMCEAKFLTKGDLTRHTRTHTGERPYACEQCGRAFNRLQALKEHMNRHMGRRPYSCKHCSKDFSEMSACYKHMKSHGRAKPVKSRVGQKTQPAAEKPGFEATSSVAERLSLGTVLLSEGRPDGGGYCGGEIVVALAGYQDTVVEVLLDGRSTGVLEHDLNLLADASTFQHPT